MNADFYAYLQQWIDEPYVLGAHDCVLFSCKWVDAKCGKNYTARARELYKYTTQRAALTRIRVIGGYAKMVEEVTGQVGVSAPTSYSVGDVALFPNGYGHDTLGLLGERLVYAPDEHGLSAVDATRIKHIWRLECLR